MSRIETSAASIGNKLQKTPTGIRGLDEIALGGLPAGRISLICGAAGAGKTLFGMEFLVHGALQYHEPGVLMAFEETVEELTKNVISLGYDLNDLCSSGRLFIDSVQVDRTEFEESGEYDLEGLFIRLADAIDRIGAKRVVLDTLEALFSGLKSEAILRTELQRLFRWLKDKGVTAVVSAERADRALTRHGLEEYTSDCVILLDHRVTEQISTRRLRIVKYRGSSHGTNEYPFLIDENGISVFPITSIGLEHHVSLERVSTGILPLDTMLGGQGVYRGSSVLISGTAGTGKTSIAAHFAKTACSRGEKTLYLAFEESRDQVIRNMRSIGTDLEPYVSEGLLRFQATRPTVYGLETHLATILKTIEESQPLTIILDPITNLIQAGAQIEVKVMLARLIDYLKSRQITAIFTSLTAGGEDLRKTDVGVSSLMDTWLLLTDIESSGERNRGLQVLKSRGMAHSNQIREFRLGATGIELLDVYRGPGGVLMGSARHAQETGARAEALARQQKIDMTKRDIERKRQLLEAQIATMRAEYEAEEDKLRRFMAQEEARLTAIEAERDEIARLRQADV